ncbi:MAG TPA: hypothetical protein VJ881_10965 [Halanaerobiales bacterium]|nr:hypothetical protein [Halanaerobiales bacterium]
MRKINKYLYWAPRILSILFICFLFLFSLDVFSPELSFSEQMLGFFIHNIPVLILIVVLIISWKIEIVGGIVFIAGGLYYIFMIIGRVEITTLFIWSLTIAGPAFLIGILFILNWIKKRQ